MAYTAAKSPTQGRPGFNISFRHPRRLDSKGKPGLKVRRGLGTTDLAEADALVAQMNELLADEIWWTAAKHQEAVRRFDRRIVDAFYDGLQAGVPNSCALRDAVIAMPGKDEGFARILFVGTTGAGKTSLLRHLIGSDPDADRFPSTSPAKTTVSDIEVIPSDGPFRAVVTFFSDVVIQANIEDCVGQACAAVWEDMAQAKVADRFLHHADQRFRLSYVLGSWQKDRHVETASDEWDFGETDNTVEVPAQELVSSSDLSDLQRTLESYVERITCMAKQKKSEIITELDFDPISASPEDREAAAEIFQAELFDDGEFHDIVQDVLEDIVRRFDRLEAGELTRSAGSSKWPSTWTFQTEDRADFLSQVRWFSSNVAPSFGRLLTPLVDGIRIAGPLFPTFTDRRSKIVLLDGQGLGHTPDTVSSLTTHVTKRFGDVDVILLVDNAKQPIQAAAQSVLRAVAASGNYAKLAVAFTHFDQVTGLNLPTFADKRAHVLASAHNYLAKLREVLSAPIVAAMERTFDQQAFMLGALNGRADRLPPGVRAELGALLDLFEKAVEPLELPDAKPKYDPSGLGFVVQRAADGFQKAWAARLGLSLAANISAEHHTRVKALNRRIANESDVEYDTLRPVADFVGRISEEVTNFLDHPLAWTRPPTSEDEAQRAIAPIRQAVYSRLHGLAMHRITRDHLPGWRRAMEYSGKGSAVRRSQEIHGIYELAVPIPGTVNTEPSLKFMKSVRSLVCSAVTEQGGSITLDA